MTKKIKRWYSVTGRIVEIEEPQPTLMQRFIESIKFIGALIALISFLVIMLFAISTTKY